MSTETPARPGGRAGRPPVCPREVALHVIELRDQGMSYEAISEELNAEGVPTPMGGPRWLKSHVDRLLHTRYVQKLREERDAQLVVLGCVRFGREQPLGFKIRPVSMRPAE